MNKDILEIKKELLSYLPIIQKEYNLDLKIIDNIVKNIDKKITFSDDTISFYVRDNVLYLPKLSYSIFEQLKHNKNYNTTNNTGVKREDYLDTTTSYIDYINHVINDGLKPIDYFKESLLHETMHMCGGHGSTPLQEGINELKTRELAQKYNIKIAAVGYQKEVEIAKILQNILGKETINKIEFLNQIDSVSYISKNNGQDAANLYTKVFQEMEKEGKIYSSYVGTVKDPYDKAKIYDSVNYDKVKNIIDEYRTNKKVI